MSVLWLPSWFHKYPPVAGEWFNITTKIKKKNFDKKEAHTHERESQGCGSYECDASVDKRGVLNSPFSLIPELELRIYFVLG